MIITKKFCDECGNEIMGGNGYYVCIDTVRNRHPGDITIPKFDICLTCLQKLSAIFDMYEGSTKFT